MANAQTHRVTDTEVLVSIAYYNSLSPSEAHRFSAAIASNYPRKSVVFRADIAEKLNATKTTEALLKGTTTVSSFERTIGRSLTAIERQVLGNAQVAVSTLATTVTGIVNSHNNPVVAVSANNSILSQLSGGYPFVAVPASQTLNGYNGYSVRDGSQPRITKDGNYVTKNQALELWLIVKLFWAGRVGQPDTRYMQVSGSSRAVSFYSQYIQIGCTKLARCELEQAAKLWNFNTTI